MLLVEFLLPKLLAITAEFLPSSIFVTIELNYFCCYLSIYHRFLLFLHKYSLPSSLQFVVHSILEQFWWTHVSTQHDSSLSIWAILSKFWYILCLSTGCAQSGTSILGLLLNVTFPISSIFEWRGHAFSGIRALFQLLFFLWLHQTHFLLPHWLREVRFDIIPGPFCKSSPFPPWAHAALLYQGRQAHHLLLQRLPPVDSLYPFSRIYPW